MQPRTRRQREVLEYIISFIEERGYEPSYQLIARHFKISSKSAIAKHIAALESQGLLSRHRENGSFGLQINSKIAVAETVFLIEWLEIPNQIFERDDFDFEPLFVPQFMIGNFSPERIFAHRVESDSNLDEHICDGDIVLVEKRPFARDGDLVVVVIDEIKVEVRKYYRHGAEIELRPSNENFQSIFVSADKISIQGVVRGLLRPFS